VTALETLSNREFDAEKAETGAHSVASRISPASSHQLARNIFAAGAGGKRFDQQKDS
jgi:hypothetical protein